MDQTTTQSVDIKSILISIGIVIVTLFILRIIKKCLIKKVAYTNKDEQHRNTLIGVIFNVLQYLVIIIALIIVLRVNHYNITSLLAGLGIAATIVGLSLQDTLKDIISGISIYSNNFYKVGDVVNYQGMTCEVKYFSARVTKFRNIFDGSTITVCNSLINSIQKVKRTQIYTLSFDWDENKEKIDAAFTESCKVLEPMYGISNVNYFGIFKIDNNGVTYGMVYDCNPKDISVPVKVSTALYQSLKKHGVKPSFSDEVKLSQIEKNN